MITGGKHGQIKITIEGDEALGKILQSIPEKAKDAAHSELKKIALDLMGKAQQLAPVDTGDLRGSAFNEVDGLEAVVGFTEPYATRQHEEMEWEHPKGGQAKYLETPYKENLPEYVKGMGETVRKAVESK